MGSREDGRMETVQLVPWDPRDKAHLQRMFDQRVACTWGSDEVDDWSEKVLQGGKYLYWIRLADDLESKDELLKAHTDTHAAERTELLDSATALGTTPRTPTMQPFIPIGHIALEAYPGRDERFGLPGGGTLWVKSLYISTVLQSAGLGRAAMGRIESMAAQPPHRCTVLALDTVAGEWQRGELSQSTFYDQRGLPRPKELRTNEGWYLRQGYELMELPPPLEDGKIRKEKGINAELGVYAWVSPQTGEEIRLPAIYMQKRIA